MGGHDGGSGSSCPDVWRGAVSYTHLNNIILLFKETSLAFTVGVIDILGKARAISSASYGSNRLEVYLAAGIIFWAVCALLEQLSKWAEKLYTKGRRQAAG